MLKEIKEVRRLQSPATRPQSLAFDGEYLWMGSIDTCRLYAIDPARWTVVQEVEAPGKPWGMTAVGDELRVICGEGSDDDRIIRRFVPGKGFTSDATPCPDNTGSQLGFDGAQLYVSQWYNKRIVPLSLNGSGGQSAPISLRHQVCGQVVVDGAFDLVTTDDENSHQYFLTRVALAPPHQDADLASIRFDARALAFDGRLFWTNHREAHQIVAFAAP